MWLNGMRIHDVIFDIIQLGIMMHKRQTRRFKKIVLTRNYSQSVDQNEEVMNLKSRNGGKPFKKFEKYVYMNDKFIMIKHEIIDFNAPNKNLKPLNLKLFRKG